MRIPQEISDWNGHHARVLAESYFGTHQLRQKERLEILVVRVQSLGGGLRKFGFVYRLLEAVGRRRRFSEHVRQPIFLGRMRR